MEWIGTAEGVLLRRNGAAAVAAMLCGGVIGYGRSRKERPAGLRTYMLVCLGAAAAVQVSLYLHTMLNGQWSVVIGRSIG